MKSYIDATHGVVANADAGSLVHRQLLDAERFAAFLQARPRYVSVRDALAGKGDALTIDDATAAAADAARLARRYGHEVTLFVNGYNVESGAPYFFSRLAHALDTAKAERIRFAGTDYPLTSHPAKLRFRRAVKETLARIGSEDARQELVAEIVRLAAGETTISPPLRALTLDELRELLDLGVELHNHGWTHVRVGALPPDEHAADIARGREWLRRSLGCDSDIFAVPNGDGLPPWPSSPHYSIWLLLEDRWGYGEIAPAVYNRRTLWF
ncbi:MAG TPA: polysaccharide deacetylase family protein [Thermoanaerobaculia bacterium]